MNTEQYNKLLQKFYDGETSVSEEKLLKESKHLSSEESIYFETLKVGKNEKSTLDFNQFVALVNKDRNIVAPDKTNNFKWIWFAASLVLIFSVGTFWLNNSKNEQQKIKIHIATNRIYKNEKEEIRKENSYEPVVEKAKPETKKLAKSDDVLDDILPKKSRMKKGVRIRYVDNSKPEITKRKSEYESNYVIINGHKITNEKDAIDVTKYSFQILANNVNHSVEQADVLNSLNMDN
jgi:hypothetical protein